MVQLFERRVSALFFVTSVFGVSMAVSALLGFLFVNELTKNGAGLWIWILKILWNRHSDDSTNLELFAVAFISSLHSSVLIRWHKFPPKMDL